MIFKQTYATSQTDLTIITPDSGKKIYISKVVLKTESNAKVEFLTSAIVVRDCPDVGGRIGTFIDMEGVADEVLSLTCGVNTTVIVLYEEI